MIEETDSEMIEETECQEGVQVPGAAPDQWEEITVGRNIEGWKCPNHQSEEATMLPDHPMIGMIEIEKDDYLFRP